MQLRIISMLIGTASVISKLNIKRSTDVFIPPPKFSLIITNYLPPIPARLATLVLRAITMSPKISSRYSGNIGA